MSREYEYLNRMLLDLGSKQVLVIVSTHVSSTTPTGYLLPDDMAAFPYQNDKTTDNEYLDISFIYHWV
jgi:hypothetical protein